MEKKVQLHLLHSVRQYTRNTFLSKGGLVTNKFLYCPGEYAKFLVLRGDGHRMLTCLINQLQNY